MNNELESVVARVDGTDASRLDKRIRLLVGTINDNFAKLVDLVGEARRDEIHKCLGYPSWTAYVADVFTVTTRLDQPHRRELVGYLSGEGMSQRAIADAVGVSKNTVTSDLREVSQSGTPQYKYIHDDFGAPEWTPAPVTTGLDDKTYQRKPPTPPRRGPITDEFRNEILKWHPRVERIRKLVADDRIVRNRDNLTGYCNDLIRFRNTLNDAIEQLGGDVG